ncbi:diaminohydroxyphosphoriboxylaminopyrimidine deaminase +5-amino-6-(5-phosphoribosylamino)uracil reductase (RibD) [Parvularcula bermudensis HTCC2503]|uniref:Riboflavin biosynthesis protein RibD n=1 Tax=Parvularcula bermudensis (strain ATCC BAA-594 / HTCC2503 / KCTC 12087) TaxID=314260 RepID=E0TCM7_PARBH|nr:bifunctional diaminohydroxyphosphoribosylaminopyrimidine deaminase/5-amino-6-(5-phosphoribosylamino)uracil reductase RibD [Parvularcula bermudensis]ADM08616.1 diaminohydroxyphosphoriboxylaminopyrimidine deaminase +5-amino-6-(5-phosphoribosylamino)uracil reductase (RibD) [Parvularcula bermudensis HTCC2503]
MTLTDDICMDRAAALGELGAGFTAPNPMVGCVLVKGGQIVGEGYHPRPGADHAEIAALKAAGAEARGAVAYVTLEPCNHYGATPPCTKALIEAGVAEVVYAVADPNPLASGGRETLQAAGIAVRAHPTLAASRLTDAWRFSLTADRPWVAAKFAATLDGRVATRGGDSQWITGPAARARSHDLRQRSGAIVVGVGTVLADNPALNPRPEGRAAAETLKVIFDSQARTPPHAACLSSPGPVLLITAEDAPGAAKSALKESGAHIISVQRENEGLCLRSALHCLRADFGCLSIMVEGGGRLLGSFADAGLIDEVWAFLAPKILGGGQCAVDGHGPSRIGEAMALTDVSIEMAGPDFLIRGRVPRGSES